MTEKQKQALDKMPSIAYWSALGGVEVKQIEYGIEDYVYCVVNAWSGKRSYHKLKLRTTSAKIPRDYIQINGHRLYTDECLRV